MTPATSPSSTSGRARTRSPSNCPDSRPRRSRHSSRCQRNGGAQYLAAGWRGHRDVTVTALSEILQTSSVGLGNVVEQKLIRDLPLQGGNFTPLLLLSPGVNPISTAQGPGANGGSELALGTEGNSGMPGSMFVNASILGQQNRSKIYYVDGIVNTSVRAGTYVALPDIDSLHEFKVESQSDKAEYGGVTGGVVNMTSKSGTNRYGGSAFGTSATRSSSARNPFRDAPGAEPAAIQSGPVRRRSRRAALQEQDVLLRFVRRLAVLAISGFAHYGAGCSRARRRLLADLPSAHHLQPVHHPHRERPAGARSVPWQRHSREPDFAGHAVVPPGLHAEADAAGQRRRQLPAVPRSGEQLERVPDPRRSSFLVARQPLLPLDRAPHQQLHSGRRPRLPDA